MERIKITNTNTKEIIDKYFPGKVTLVLQKKNQGVRIPDYPLITNIAKAFGRAFTATSANESTKNTPYSYNDFIKTNSKAAIELVSIFIDAGPLNKNVLPSTVVQIIDGKIETLRKGPIEVTLD